MARDATAAEGLPAPDTDAVENGSDGPATVRIKVSPGGTRPDVRILISEDEEGSSSMSSVFTLCNSAIGAGVLSLPYAFRKSGQINKFASRTMPKKTLSYFLLRTFLC